MNSCRALTIRRPRTASARSTLVDEVYQRSHHHRRQQQQQPHGKMMHTQMNTFYLPQGLCILLSGPILSFISLLRQFSKGECCTVMSRPLPDSSIYKNGPSLTSFIIYFRLFKKALKFLQQYM